ncbi:Predicted methyltransferase, contains TPR repeat [Rhizobium sp. RU35A]|uniref:methyltransferase n=1 Tax=Rhizobium sp. RU35A TaxID=1907414 RepID=UPI00095626F1|nr:methyltransferase domain-containing protein [Rhizobium sp. RU35A]SIQ03692.1 Predicted methyltransferase, contains TPR repeat [Rhizobium sp. RU35A]
MTPLQFSSGDVIADRRADYARMLAEAGDPAAAAELIEQALEIVPGWTAGWFLLGDYRDKAGLPAAAVEAFRQVAEQDRSGLFGADLKLALLGAAPTPDAPPSAYVEGLFDDYADRFETALVEKLNYSVPQKLHAMVAPHAPFDLAVDLGCGTGLFGVEVAAVTGRLEGFDLSANMLAKADEKGIYHHLGQADLSVPEAAGSLFAEGLPRGRADLVCAADVLMYLGRLDMPFVLARDLLKPGGLFAFSVEDGGAAAEGFCLQPSLRYAHSQDYVRGLLSGSGFTLLDLMKTDIRMDAGKPVFGILFLARLTA